MLEEIPDFLWQVSQLVENFPLIQHVAQFLDLIVHKGLLFIGEGGKLNMGEFFPVRATGKQVGLEPGSTGFNGLALGVADGGHDLAKSIIDRLADELLAQINVVEQSNAGGQQDQ